MDPALLYVAAAIAVYFASTLVYALRWKIVLEGFGRRARYGEAVKAMLSAIFVNNITPLARAGGEAIRIVWMNAKEHIPKSLLTASIVYERATEAIIVALLVIAIVASYVDGYTTAIVLLVAALAVLLISRVDIILRIVERVSKERIPSNARKEIIRNTRFGKTLLTTLALSATLWGMDILRIKLELLAVGLNMSWTRVAAISVLNVLIGLVAITPGGIGIVEGGLLGILTGMGLGLGDAAKVVAIERGISYVLASIVGAAVTTIFGGKEVWRRLRSRS